MRKTSMQNDIKSIKEILDESLKRMGLDGKMKQSFTLQGWNDVVGKEIAERTKPINIKGKTLFVAVVNSSWLYQLTLLHDEIIKKLNARMGENCVKKIRFQLGPVETSLQSSRNAHFNKSRATPLTREERDRIEKILEPLQDSNIIDVVRNIMIKDFLLKKKEKGHSHDNSQE